MYHYIIYFYSSQWFLYNLLDNNSLNEKMKNLLYYFDYIYQFHDKMANIIVLLYKHIHKNI